MRFIFILFMSGWLLSACSSAKHTSPTYVFEKETEAVMDSIAQADTSTNIVVYNVNVIVPKQEKEGMSNENQRLIISELGAIISTIVALFIVADTTP